MAYGKSRTNTAVKILCKQSYEAQFSALNGLLRCHRNHPLRSELPNEERIARTPAQPGKPYNM